MAYRPDTFNLHPNRHESGCQGEQQLQNRCSDVLHKYSDAQGDTAEASILHGARHVQAVFTKERGTPDLIANIHWVLESSEEFQNVSPYFINYSKAFNCVVPENLGVAQKKMSMPSHSIIQVRNLHCRQEATVRTKYEETKWFPTGKAVRQE